MSAWITAYVKEDFVGIAHIAYKKYNTDFSDLVVSPDFRNRGIATSLINRALELTKSRQRQGMGLVVVSKNYIARRLYDKLGFIVVHEYSDGDIAMYKKV